MSVKIINKLSSPTLGMTVEQGILDALVTAKEDWWVGVFEFRVKQSFQVVIVGPGLAWNETFPKREDWVEVRGLMSYAVKSAIGTLQNLRAEASTLPQAS
jgi:hypothetical protein